MTGEAGIAAEKEKPESVWSSGSNACVLMCARVCVCVQFLSESVHPLVCVGRHYRSLSGPGLMVSRLTASQPCTKQAARCRSKGWRGGRVEEEEEVKSRWRVEQKKKKKRSMGGKKGRRIKPRRSLAFESTTNQTLCQGVILTGLLDCFLGGFFLLCFQRARAHAE